MAINKITKYELESRAIELRAKPTSHANIAAILSEESKQVITTSSVQRFFASRDDAKVQVIEKSDKLKAKVVEAEINTIAVCMECVADLKEICEGAKKAGDYKTAIQAIDKIYPGLDMVNKILGKYQTSPQIQINNQQVNIDDKREQLISGIVRDSTGRRTTEAIE